MLLSAHLATGLIIGSVTDSYTAALAGALLVDLDHLLPYVEHRIIFDAGKFWRVSTSEADPFDFQRNYLHSFFAWAVLSLLAVLISFGFGLVFCVSYFVHLLLDMLDASDFTPFYPFKYKLRGPVGYFSNTELVFTLVLFAIFFSILSGPTIAEALLR